LSQRSNGSEGLKLLKVATETSNTVQSEHMISDSDSALGNQNQIQ
jgi:hypothetical protein